MRQSQGSIPQLDGAYYIVGVDAMYIAGQVVQTAGEVMQTAGQLAQTAKRYFSTSMNEVVSHVEARLANAHEYDAQSTAVPGRETLDEWVDVEEDSVSSRDS